MTTRVALIYPHTENGQDQMIAGGMGKLAEAALKKIHRDQARKVNGPAISLPTGATRATRRLIGGELYR